MSINLEEQIGVASKLQAEGRIENYELLLRRKDGAIRNGLLSGTLISSHGGQFLLAVVIDITERKTAEPKLHEERQRANEILCA